MDEIEVAALRMVVRDLLANAARKSENGHGFLQDLKDQYGRLADMALEAGEDEKHIKMLTIAGEAQQVVIEAAEELDLRLE